MNIETARNILHTKEPADLYDVVTPSIKSAVLRDLLTEGSFAKDETFRYNSVRVLYRAAEKRPDLFYPYWDRFAEMIGSPNGFHRSIAAQVIALLTPADTDCRLDLVFNRYLKLLDDPKVMVTHYFLETLAFVYRARPDLRHRLAVRLLEIDKSDHTAGHKEMLKADILSVFDAVYEDIEPADLRKVRAFVEAGLENKSPKTRKAAKEFLRKHA